MDPKKRPEIIPPHYQLAGSISECSKARWIKILEGKQLRTQGDFHQLQTNPYWAKVATKKQAYYVFVRHLQKRIDSQEVWIDLNK